MNVNVAFVIKMVRKDKKLTQAELAEELGITPGHLGSLEQGRANPSYGIMKKIVVKYNIDANIFFGKTQQEAKPMHDYMAQFMKDKLSEVSEEINEYIRSINHASFIDDLDEE